MPVILQVDFSFPGPFGAEMATQLTGLAESISQEPGFLWKIWTESESRKEAGGIYLFSDRASAEAYLEMHSKRLQGFGVPSVNAKIFEVNEALTKINHGPLSRFGPILRLKETPANRVYFDLRLFANQSSGIMIRVCRGCFDEKARSEDQASCLAASPGNYFLNVQKSASTY